MDSAIKHRWQTALESGAYQKGHGALKQMDHEGNLRYCCLGVLCELAVEDGVIPPSAHDSKHWNDRIFSFGKDADMTSGYLPDSVKDWAGLEYSNPRVSVPGHERARTWSNDEVNLADLNDSGHYTFSYIASFIEKHF